MTKETKLIEGAKRILAAFDKAIVADKWDKSILIRATGKKLRSLRQKLNAAIQTAEGMDVQVVEVVSTSPTEGQQTVYISLYNADGDNLNKWQSLVRSLVTHAVTRPVYQQQQDIDEMIRHRPNPKTEGYVIVNVDKSMIIMDTEARVGERITLKDKAVKLEHITRFIHQSGEYRCENGHLSPAGDGE